MSHPGLRDILKSWQEMCAEISCKSYDYLDYRDRHFDDDLEVFAASVRELLRRIHMMVEKEHEEIWETPMANKMLARCGGAGGSPYTHIHTSICVCMYI